MAIPIPMGFPWGFPLPCTPLLYITDVVYRAKQQASYGLRSTHNSAASSGGRLAAADEMMVPKTMLDEKLQELLAKDETIQVCVDQFNAVAGQRGISVH